MLASGPVSTSRAGRAAQVARDQAAADRLTSAWLVGTWARIKGDLASLTADMERARDPETGKVPVSWLYREQRLRKLQQQVAAHVGQYASLAHQTVSGEMLQAAHDGAGDAHAALTSMIPAGVTYAFDRLPTAAINQIVQQADNGRLSKLFGQFAPDAAARARDALVQGIAVGDSPAKMAARVRDSLSVPLSRAMTISRTESLTAYNAANVAQYQQHADMLDGWKWLTGPDPCPECAENAGRTFGLDDDPPPLHPNCRCTSSPVTKSWDEILGNEGGDDGNSAA